VGDHAAHPAAGQDAQRVQARRDEVAVQFGRRAEQRPDVGGERLRPAEERPHPDLGQARYPVHRRAEEGLHPLPVGRQFAEREAPRHPVQRPGRCRRLEQADQHPVALGPVVAVVVRVLDHRQVGVHAGHGVGEQVVVLGRLQRHGDPGQRAELPRPHAGRVHHDLGLDRAGLGEDGADPPPAGPHAGRGHALDHPRAQLPGALGQRGGHAHRVGPALVGDVERRQHVVGAGQRPHGGDLGGRDLGVLDAEPVHPGRLAAQRVLPLATGGQREVPDRAEPGGVPGLGLQPGVQVARVPAEEQRGLVGHAGRGDQPGGVPGRPGGQPVLLEQNHVGPAQVREVVGDAAAGHPAADNHHLCPAGDSPAHGSRIDRHDVPSRRARPGHQSTAPPRRSRADWPGAGRDQGTGACQTGRMPRGRRS
jgi:hypothetical protein